MTTRARHRTRIGCHGLLGSFAGLTGFATNLLADVTNALAMIRLRRAHAADLGRSLAHNFTIVAKHLDDAGLLIDFEVNPGRGFHLYRMGVAHEQSQVFSL